MRPQLMQGIMTLRNTKANIRRLECVLPRLRFVPNRLVRFTPTPCYLEAEKPDQAEHAQTYPGAKLDAHEACDRVLLLAAIASSEDQKKASTKEDRLSGTVHMIDKGASTIVIRKGVLQRAVVYNAATKFTIQNQSAGSIDDVIVGRRVTCLGMFNDRTQLIATWIDIRTK